MTAEIVSVGTEHLLGQIVDTHAPYMARILADCGITCTRRQTVGDNLERLTESLLLALERVDIVVCIGGLGPTQDDVTREAIAAALTDDLVLDPSYEQTLKDIFSTRRFTWVESNRKQAMRPTSGRFIDNPNGTAPGLICQKRGKVVIAIPGPRNEFNPMADGPIRAFLETVEGGQVIHSRILRICGLGESYVEDQIANLHQNVNPTGAPYAHPAEVHLRLTARAATREEADDLIDPLDWKIRQILGAAVYGTNDTTLEESVIRQLTEREETLAVAESLTGGWLGERLTAVSGSGEVFLGGMITYDLGVKENFLGVKTETLAKHGPVSEQTAHQMAKNIREMLKASYGISLTGNAGPTADVDDKPVGLVYIGLAGPKGVNVKEYRLRGARNDIRQRCTQLALVQLREVLLLNE